MPAGHVIRPDRDLTGDRPTRGMMIVCALPSGLSRWHHRPVLRIPPCAGTAIPPGGGTPAPASGQGPGAMGRDPMSWPVWTKARMSGVSSAERQTSAHSVRGASWTGR